MLLAAGFAPVYRESNLAAPELAPVRQAIDRMLKQQEPYPAIVIDRLWNLHAGQRRGQRLHGVPVRGPAAARRRRARRPTSCAGCSIPRRCGPSSSNWEEVARHLVSTTYAEILADGGEPKALAFIEEIMAYPDVPASFRKLRFEERPHAGADGRLHRRRPALSVFTTIATLGTPQDITLQEVRIECFFPADERSDALFKSLAAKG